MPALSVIVPIYNSEKYLSQCIDSILGQKFKDFELVLVNDGSSDSSLAICQKYEDSDHRIKVLNKCNGGVSSARNLGLENAVGDWIMFVDSDDSLIDNSLDKIFQDQLDADMIIGAAQLGNDSPICSLEPIGLLNVDEIRSLLTTYVSHPLLCAPWAKLFNRDLLNKHQVRFNESLSFGEDAVFVKEYLLHVARIQISPCPLYLYVDIGDDIYKKYAKSFAHILNYYLEICKTHSRLQQKYEVEISLKQVVGVVYNMALECINKRGENDWLIIQLFLTDSTACSILRQRNSFHVNNLLSLAKCNYTFFIIYFKIIEFLKKLIINVSK